MISVLLITDGRDDYLEQCVLSLREQVAGPISERWMFDDTGDERHRAKLTRLYPEFEHINAGPRRGFGGAIANAWSTLWQLSAAPFVFHVEGDFIFEHPVDLGVIAEVLDEQPHLAQMALRRQPWASAEVVAGGVVEQHPEAYMEISDPTRSECAWLQHRLFWTTNPSLYRRTLVGRGWPDVPGSESAFTQHLLRVGTPEVEPERVRFSYWGARDSGVWVRHIGDERAGHGY